MKTFLSIVLLIALLNISGGFATNWYVCSPPSSSTGTTGTSPSSGLGTTIDTAFSTLKDALAAAKSGDIINLQAGVFSGPDNIGLTVNVSNVQILGINVATVFIDLGGSPIFLNINVPGVVVAQLTIKNGINANVNVLNGVATVNAHVGCINVNLAVVINLDAIKILNVKFLNIQGTAVAVVDANLLNNAVNVNLNVFLNVIISGCTFTNVTEAPTVFISGQISLRLSNVNFQNCGSSANPGLLGVVLQALKGSVVTLIATVNINGCIGGTLIDLDTAATLNLGGLLSVQACVVLDGLLNLNANLNVNILGLSVSLNDNTYTQDCLNIPSCGIINIGLICGKYACPLLNLGNVIPLEFFY